MTTAAAGATTAVLAAFAANAICNFHAKAAVMVDASPRPPPPPEMLQSPPPPPPLPVPSPPPSPHPVFWPPSYETIATRFSSPVSLQTNDLARGLGKVRLYVDSDLSPQHKNREGGTQASGVADTADETGARSKRCILYICRPQSQAPHRSIRARWSHKSTEWLPTKNKLNK